MRVTFCSKNPLVFLFAKWKNARMTDLWALLKLPLLFTHSLMHHCPNKFQVSANNNFSPGVNTFRDLSQDLTIFNQKFWVLKLSLAKSWTTFSNSKLQRFFVVYFSNKVVYVSAQLLWKQKKQNGHNFAKQKIEDRFLTTWQQVKF